MTGPLRVEVTATDGEARTTTVSTARGTFRTPLFMPVGTRGLVKALDAADLSALGFEVILANTYHLMLRPGADVVAGLGGLHDFTGWSGHMLTDSGGFQVFSLHPEVDDDGATFRSTYDGSRHRLTPERAVAVQEALGADIQMVLDVCPPLPSPDDALRLAVDRTVAWAGRAKAAHRRRDQSLFGIVQGGTDPALRRECAERLVELEFVGYGIGGLSVGEPRSEMLATLAATVPYLPVDAPRYLMGVGDPVAIVEAVALGVDLFDCVLPSRLARHGSILTSVGRLSVRAARYARDDAPLDPACRCTTCQRHSRGFLRHLLSVGEPAAARLLTIHNLAFVADLVDRTRQAVVEGRLDRLRSQIAAIWI